MTYSRLEERKDLCAVADPGEVAVARATRGFSSSRAKTAMTIHGGRLALLLVLLTVWQSSSPTGLDPFFFSRPLDIVAALWRMAASGELWTNMAITLFEAFVGYCIGATLGTLAAIVLGSALRVYAVFEPILLILFATPAVAIAPLIIIWLGIGLTPKIVLAAWFVFCIVLMNGVAGVRAIPTGWLKSVQLMGASRLQIFAKVKLRGAIPHLIAGYKSALPQSVIGALVGEFISARRGIGYLIAEASGKFDTAGTFAAILVLATLVLLMFSLLQIGMTAADEGAQ